jgi:hypothetical protein
VSSFSTMTSLKSSVPQTLSKRDYDPEIKDIASYIHNTSIDSELAVGSMNLSLRSKANAKLCVVRHCSLGFRGHARLRS